MEKLAKFERPALAVVALIAWFGVVLQYYVLFQKPALSGMNALQITLLFLDFFTTLTNLLVAVASTISLIAPQSAPGRFFSTANVSSAIALYIGLVGVLFNVLLRSIDVRESFADKLANEVTHLIVPVIYLVYWLLCVSKGELNWRQPFYWLIYPLLYLPWVFIYGNFTGRYPYPFLHVGDLGYSAVLVNSAGLIVVFLVAGAILVGIDKLMRRKT